MNAIAPATEEYERAERITGKLVEDMARVIALREMHARAGYQSDIVDAVGRSHEAWGFNIILNSLYFELILTPMRIHDEEGENTASLGELVSLMRRSDVLEALREDNIAHSRMLTNQSELPNMVGAEAAERSAVQRGEEWFDNNKRKLQTVIEDYGRLKSSHLISSLRLYRNKILAHNTIDIDNVKGQRRAKYGDADILVDKTIDIIDTLSKVVIGLDPNFNDTIEVWKERANDFWVYAAHLSERRRRRTSRA